MSDALGRNAAVMAAGTAVSRVLGVIRNTMLVAAVGLTSSLAADAFAIANWLPNVFYMLLAGGVLNAVLVPQVVRAYRSANGQEYVDRLLTLAFAIFGGATLLLTLAAPLIVRLIVSDPAQVDLATAFAFICLPQVFFYGVYTLLGQVLNARGIFGPYMWAPVVNNVVAIAGLAVFIAAYGGYVASPEGVPDDLSVWDGGRITILAGTATLGVVAQALILAVPLYRSGFRYRPRGRWRGTGLGKAGQVAGWTFAALAAGQVGVLVVMRVAAAASDTQLAGVAGNNAYNNAFGIFMLPHSLVTVSLVTALFTRLSDHAAARDVAAVRADFSQGLRTIAVFTLFAAPALSVLAVPLVRVLYPTTRTADVTAMAPIIVAFMAGLVAVGAWALCQRVFYAYEDAKGLFRIQVIMAGVVATTALLGWLVAPPQHWVAWSAAGIAASYVVGAVWGGAQVWRRLGGGLSRIIRLHVRAGLAAVVATGLGWLVSRLFGDVAAGGWFRALATCVVVGLVMLGTYLLLLRRLGVTELDDVLRPLMSRLRRSMSTPGAAQGAADAARPGAAPVGRGGDRLDVVIGRGTLLAGRYRLHQPVVVDLPGVEAWTARDQILDRPVRALVVRSGNVAGAQDAARRAALVSDRRLLRVLDVGDHEGVAYTVTEPVVGQDLAQLTARGPLDADQARAVVGEAAAALEVARRRGVHHLALRPSAVHVTPDGSVLVSGLAMDGELLGRAGGDAKTTSRADTVGLVALLYLALTGRWPDTPAVLAGPAGVSVAPAVAGAPVPPAELSPAVPNDLDTLCAVTLGPHDDGPHSPGELVRELEPWGAVDPDALFGSLDAVDRPATVPSGPWSADGSAAARAARQGPFTEVVDPDLAVGAAGAGAAGAGGPGGGTPPPVQRQSVRASFSDPDATAVRAGTPPPAQPPTFRRPDPPAATSAWSGPTAVMGAPPAAGTGAEAPVRAAAPTGPAVPVAAHQPPPVLPPPSRPAPRGDDFDEFITRSDDDDGQRRGVNATPIVLTLIALLVIGGLVWAFRSLTAPAPPIGGDQGFDLTEDDEGDPAAEPDDGQDGEEPAPADPAATPSAEPTQPTSGTPPVIASAQMIDPPPGGDQNEHPEAVPLAIDGDPTTKWYSRMYTNPAFGMKPGIGYAVTLAEPATVTTVTLLVNGAGGNVEIRATDPSTPTEGDVLASGPLEPTTVFTLSQPTEAQHIVVWVTQLPQNPTGENRIELFEIQLA